MNTAVPEQGGPPVLDALSPAIGRPAVDALASPVARRGLTWWLWPHVLSLDAPIVAVVWQHWWAHAAGVKILWFQDAILALGVWTIYLADRLADTRPAASATPLTARHAFSSRHRRVLLPLLACVALGLVVLTLAEVPARQLAAGFGLLLVAAWYFWLIHRRRPSHWARLVPKEAFVGAIFAFGTTFFVTWRAGLPPWPVGVSRVFFGVLCFLNCALITQWETSVQDRTDPTSLLNAFPWLDGRLGTGCMGLAAAAGLLTAGAGWVAFLPVALGALALAWLDHQRETISPDARRVLADFALFAPLLCGGWLW